MYQKRKIKNWIQKLEKNQDRKEINKLHPAQISHILKFISKPLQEQILLELPDNILLQVLLRSKNYKKNILNQLNTKRIRQLMYNGTLQDQKVILENLSYQKRQTIFSQMTQAQSKVILELLKYKKGTAGWIMDKEFIAVQAKETVNNLLHTLRSKAGVLKELYVIFVIDERGKLIGYVSLKCLLLAFPEDPISKIMNTNIVSVTVNMEQEAVAHIAKEYDVLSLAVTDTQKRLVGRITLDDLMDVMNQEMEKDIHQITGLALKKEGWFGRFPWLVLGFIGGILAFHLIRQFQFKISDMLVLSFFTPMILSMGGCLGVQASTVILRGLAIGEIYFSNMFQYVLKEVKNTFFNALLCSIILFVFVFYYLNLKMASTLAISLFAVMNMSGFLGSTIPFLLKRFKVEPSVAAGPVMMVLNDLISLLVYFSIALLIQNVF